MQTKDAMSVIVKMEMSNQTTCMIDMNMTLQNPQLHIDQNEVSVKE